MGSDSIEDPGQVAGIGSLEGEPSREDSDRPPGQQADEVAPSVPPRADAAPADTPSSPPFSIREPVSVLLFVLLADLTLYSGYGYAGFAVFFALSPILLVLGSAERKRNGGQYVLAGMMCLLSVGLVWEGSTAGVATGYALLLGLVMALAGLKPFVVEGCPYSARVALRGVENLALYARNLRSEKRLPLFTWIAVLVPATVIFLFGLIFVLANPVLTEIVRDALRTLVRWLEKSPVTPKRVLFWVVVAWCTAGFLRPRVTKSLVNNILGAREEYDNTGIHALPLYVYPVARNTLLAVVVLFAFYLTFEVAYLWVREIPKGFYYSGYAHRGAAWLTVALAFSTFTLGAIFNGALLDHPRIGSLKKLTHIWSVENLLLALCVFHRLYSYIQYNGMSRMRVVALFGIAAVVAGFLLCVWKVLTGKNLLWLVRRDLWALFGVVFVHSLFPVDRFVTAYNVKQILSGNPSPSVQLAVHPIGPSGLPRLVSLTDHGNERIREGAKALLANPTSAPKRLKGPIYGGGGQNWVTMWDGLGAKC